MEQKERIRKIRRRNQKKIVDQKRRGIGKKIKIGKRKGRNAEKRKIIILKV